MRVCVSVFLALASPVYGQELVFQGTATVAIDTYQYDPYSGQDYLVAQVEKQFGTKVILKNPKSTPDLQMTEDNPFALSIWCDPILAEGSTSIASAMVVTAPYTGRRYLAQYWTYDYDMNDGWLEGTLTDNHARESIGLNAIQVHDPYIKTFVTRGIANGASIYGYVFQEWVHLMISGTTIDTYTHFTMEVQASIGQEAAFSMASGSQTAAVSAPTGSSSNASQIVVVSAPTGSNSSEALVVPASAGGKNASEAVVSSPLGGSASEKATSDAFAAHHRMAGLLLLAFPLVVVSVSI